MCYNKTDSQKEYIDLEVSHILQTKETSSRVYFNHHTRNGLKTDHSSMIFYKRYVQLKFTSIYYTYLLTSKSSYYIGDEHMNQYIRYTIAVLFAIIGGTICFWTNNQLGENIILTESKHL